MKKYLKIEAKTQGEFLNVKAEPVGVEKGGKYTYRLKRGAEILAEIKSVYEEEYNFKLDAYGQYYVQVSYVNQDESLWASSKLVLYSKLYEEEYKNFCDTPRTANIDKLPYFDGEYPFSDFCLLWGDYSVTEELTALMTKQGLNRHEFVFENNTICSLYAASEVVKYGKNDFVFSGITKTEKSLIVGCKDIIRNGVTYDMIENEIGDFFLIYQDGKTVKLSHDYLGLCKFYYYQTEDTFVVTNRYHLLLLTLKAMGIFPEVNIERAIADLSSVSAFARINFCREMLMKNTYVLTSDKDIAITKDAVCFTDNALHEELYNPQPYNEETYQELLLKGANEMLENMRLALEYSDIDYYQVDLSGGLDSRMVLALITNYPQYHKEIQLNTRDLPYAPKDLVTALAINSMYDYPWDTLPIITSPLLKKQSLEQILSGYFCINQQPMPTTADPRYKDSTMSMPGLLGELVFRPHMYTKFKLTTEEDQMSIEEFINNRWYYNIESISEEGYKRFTDYLIKEYEMMPGQGNIEKMQNHYLIYMDSIHHATYYPTTVTHMPKWTVLVSKTIFHLNNVTGKVFKSNKLAHDLMTILNPALAAIPYEKDLYNKELQALAETNPRYGNVLKIDQECIDIQRAKWKKAQEEKTANAKYAEGALDNREAIVEENAKFDESLIEKSLEALYQIIKYKDGAIGDVVGLDCYSRILAKDELPDNAKWVKWLYTKILTLYHALKIFDYVD